MRQPRTKSACRQAVGRGVALRRRLPDLERRGCRRAGVATLDYVLVLGIILPLAAIVIPAGKRILELVYEMICTLIAWPFM